MASEEIVITRLPSGVSTKVLGSQAFDWDSIRILAERGVTYKTIAKHFNGLPVNTIVKHAIEHNWLTPCRTKRMVRDVGRKQEQYLANVGAARDPDEVMAEIWKERQTALNERTFEVVEQALGAITPDIACTMIEDAKDLKTIVDTGRIITGESAREKEVEAKASQMAVNVGFLRSASVEIIDV